MGISMCPWRGIHTGTLPTGDPNQFGKKMECHDMQLVLKPHARRGNQSYKISCFLLYSVD